MIRDVVRNSLSLISFRNCSQTPIMRFSYCKLCRAAFEYVWNFGEMSICPMFGFNSQSNYASNCALVISAHLHKIQSFHSRISRCAKPLRIVVPGQLECAPKWLLLSGKKQLTDTCQTISDTWTAGNIVQVQMSIGVYARRQRGENKIGNRK